MTEPRLDAYLRRIGVEGPLKPDLESLTRLHRAHLTRISYENLDIHFGRPLSLELDEIHRKIVAGRRGGWCFEMNTLLRWALENIGFNVTLLSGTAAYESDHTVLAVDVAGVVYLADMGWGNGFLEPLPLAAGSHVQGHRRFELTQAAGGAWRFSNLDFGEDGFTFSLAPRSQSFFAERSRFLQTDPESSFVRVVKAFRFEESGRLHFLRGAVLSTFDPAGQSITEIESVAGYESVWRDVFGIDDPDVASLWPKVHSAHLAWKEEKQKERA